MKNSKQPLFLTRFVLCLLLTIGLVNVNAQTSGCPDFKTFSQGGWGGPGGTGNPGSYRDLYFATAFPNGLTVGCGDGYTAKFTSAVAIQNYLPGGGTPAALTANLSNPTASAGNLVSQVVALTLSVGIDAAVDSFASAAGNLKDLKIQNTATVYDGMTVTEFLTIANNVLGGCNTNASYTSEGVATVAALLNLNYDGLTNGVPTNNGYLRCPILRPIPTPLASSLLTTCFGVNGGSIDLNIEEGLAPFTFSWSSSNNANFTSALKNLTGIPAGTYTVTITDALDQTVTLSITIGEFPAMTTSVTHTNLACNTSANATVDLEVNGGTAPFTYLWDYNAASTQDLTNVGAGTYSVTVTDANGCSKADATTIIAPPLLTASATHDNVMCHGTNTGSIDLTVNGGTGAYRYVWNDGAITQDRPNMVAGTYSVIVTDANQCTATTTETITISEPAAALSASATRTNVFCNGETTGTIDLTVSGGVEPYSYSWSNGEITADLTGLAAGTYSVTITDANDCSTTASATVTEPARLTASATATDVLCNGGSTGSVDLTVNGGTEAYTYLWDNAAATQDLTNVGAATYSVTVTDANHCSTTASATVGQPAVLGVTVSAVNANCIGGVGQMTANVTGGTSAYQYSWNSAPVQTSAMATGLPKGTYTVTVTDARGCGATATGSIIEVPVVACGFLTYSQGGWGATAKGGNAGAYLKANWSSIGTIVVGSGTKTLTLSSYQAVDAFLPAGGTPAVLAASLVNPGASYTNGLAAQLVALTISLKFDAALPAFAPSAGYLGNQIIATGTFAGSTVTNLVNIANQVLGGSSNAYSPAVVAAALENVIKNYDAGVCLGSIVKPCVIGNGKTDGASETASFSGTPTQTFDQSLTFTCFPNPAVSSDVNVSFGLGYASEVTVDVYNISGEKVATLFNNSVEANQSVQVAFGTKDVAPGVYFCRMTTANESKMLKMVIAK